MIGGKVGFSDAILIQDDDGEGYIYRAGSDYLKNPMDFTAHRKTEAECWDVGIDEAENGLGHKDEELGILL